ncbi:hypothetical protein PEQA60_07020 [Pseudomonas sp. Eqa60]|jgi:hypothetical protein|uniref:DUF3613 domain-containing protein n=1 Tax=Pseudomonas TaxID=286 RepID=UPI00098D6879|nr:MULTISPECIES: DUF3613 domain-containing protein [Pseudomonas]GED77655.1 hypothetical protein PFL02_45050 [Pseudomonas fluorescens]AQT07437.1 hypothetical protein H78_00711 [Pseudomonas protegens]MDF4210458.1 DUF3613 domain-containing protein [Pseudomonas protegens]NTZ74924.1 DUF3613 domain-containing protein [Pseudomonas protegens]UVL73329.1 DUF3613 domain-containing protein [Pseudomonas protegens]
MMKLPMFYCTALLALPLAAQAIEAGPASPQQQETEAWLLLQNRNLASSPQPQTATPTERELALQRWMKKYKYEIPDLYDPDAGGKVETK